MCVLSNLGDFSITTGGNDEIYEIFLFTPAFETFRGIRVGDGVSDALEKYGSDVMISQYYYTYSNNARPSKFISFSVDENGITRL